MEHHFGGIWTLEKLDILSKYLNFFTDALKKTRFQKLYIDAFAGTGYCTVRIDGREQMVPGSAQRALDVEPPFDQYIFLEDHRTRARQLEALAAEHPNRNIQVHVGDCNRFLPRLLAKDWSNRRAVLFLDPYGLQVDWPTVQAIAATRAVDTLFLVSLSGIYRQAARDSLAMDESKVRALNRFLGTTEWKDAFYDRDAPGHTPDLFDTDRSQRSADWRDIAEYIRTRLAGVFLGGVQDPAILKKDSTPLFALYFALANPSKKAQELAHRVAKQIMRLP